MHVKKSTADGVVATYPLSAQQRRICLRPDQTIFSAQCAALVEGPLDAGRLRDALRSVVEGHEVLRTTFNRRAELKLPLQTVHESMDFDWREILMSGWESRVREAELAETLRQQSSEPFDLERGPLLRAWLLRIDERRSVLALNLPALCGDAVSLRLLVAALGRAYHRTPAAAETDGDSLPYAAFSCWQNQLQQDDDDDARRARAHWDRQGSATLAPTSPDQASAGPASGRSPSACRLDLAPEVVVSLDSLAERLDLSVRAILLACWGVIAGRLSGQPNVVIGELFEGRNYEEFQQALGLYARCLPIGASLKAQQRFSGLARQLQGLQDQAVEFGDYAALDDQVAFPIGFQYGEWQPRLEVGELSFTFLRQHAWLEASELSLTCARVGGGLRLELFFDPVLFQEADAERLLDRVPSLLDAIVNRPGIVIDDLPTLGVRERRQVLVEFNDSDAAFRPCQSVQQLFEEQAEEKPDAVAVVCAGRSLTYRELNRRANRIAHHLSALGLMAEQRVGLFMERSETLLIGLLGILKAGAAYVPLDTALPKERIAMHLLDAQADLVLTERRLAESLPLEAGLRPVFIDDGSADGRGEENPHGNVTAANLAYVLFTSGSTGRPKGVAVEHGQLINYINAVGEKLSLPPAASYATVSTFAADLGNTMIFSALCGGGCLHVVAQEVASDPVAFGDYMSSSGVDCLKIVPSHLGALLHSSRPEDLLPRRLLMLGGEAAPMGLVERVKELAPHCRVINHYGPTETTVGVLTFEHRPQPPTPSAATLPVGRPLANCKVYLLGDNLGPVPAMAAGELCVGGLCVSRGYLGRPDLTAEKFLPDPSGPVAGARIYRTGDLARLLPGAAVEFLGRVDNQVKVRGYRIELGEVEARLCAHPGVWKAVVVARAREQSKQLAAFVIAKPESGLTPSSLRAELARTLPDYMIPSSIVFLDSLPLTPNGKVDRQALAAADRVGPEAGSQMAPPRNAEEETLAAIWAEILGLPAVNISDNFFELGGDSILAIQVVARANRAGLRLTPKQIFDNQTLAELAAVVGTTAEIEAEQGLVTGGVRLTPIQHWFFEQEIVEPNHWNQSVMLQASPALTPAIVEAAVLRIVAHHDALRLRVRRTDEGWRQSIAGMEGAGRSFDLFDLSAAQGPDLSKAIAEIAGQVQSGLSLSEGPVARFALFDFGGGGPKRLLIAIHHLAVDAFSWRILLEDLETACGQLLKNEAVDLPPKTSSVKQWSERLTEHVAAGAFADETAFWLELEGGGLCRLPQAGRGPNTIVTATSLTCSLSPEETSALLHELAETYGAQVNDVLLTAVARGFARCTTSNRLLVDMEGHGREYLFDDLDTSRTVGWFTTHFPVLLDIGGAENSYEALRLVKDQSRRIPNNGIGYGLLRYLSKDEEAVGRLRALPEADIKFNYLGRYDQVMARPLLFSPADEPRGAERDPRSPRTHLLDLDALVLGERLCLRWTYSENVYDRETISHLAEAVQDELRRLIVHEDAEETDFYARADFPLVRLDERSLEQVVLTALAAPGGPQAREARGKRRVEDIYPVSPLQESLLYSSLSSKGTGAGFEQKSLLLRGDFDLGAFARTWQELVDRHTMLRTAFVIDSAAGVLQVVVRRARIELEQHDWRALPPSSSQEMLGQYLREDIKRGFDPACPPLMRVAVIRLGEDAYQIVWSYHHLLIDAWCRNLVLKEVFESYEVIRRGETPALPARRPYRDYIAWLQRQDYASAEQFWRGLLQGIAAPTRLPLGGRHHSDSQNEEVYQSRSLRLTDSETEVLASFSRSNKLTLNTLVHAAWALLLTRYCDTEDVLFGTTVSGRPPGLADSEAIIGMFVNNLPARFHLPGTAQVASALRGVQDLLVRMREYEWVSPIRLQEWSDIRRGQRLFESLLIFQNFPAEGGSDGASAGLEMSDLRSRLETTYPLTVVVGPFEPLTFRVFYDRKRFADSEIGRLADHLRVVLNGFAAGGESRRISDVPMLTEAELRQSLGAAACASLPLGEKRSLRAALEERAYRFPEAVAVRQQQGLSWGELNRRANRLAHRLVGAGAGPGRLVAILLNRDLEFAAGLLAVLKTGASFVVLDPSASAKHLSQQLEQTDAQGLLTTRALSANLPPLRVSRVFVDDAEAAEADGDLRQEAGMESLACLHYDGGSQAPVKITDETLFEQASRFYSVVAPEPSDVIVVAAESPSLAAIEMLEALAAGVPVILADDETARQPERLMRLLSDSGATILQAPPLTWRLLLGLGWRAGQNFKAICPARRLPPVLCRELSARAGCLLKVYMAGVGGRWLASCQVAPERADEDFSLLGRPAAGKLLQLLSRQSQAVPVGVTGEICLSDVGDREHCHRTGDLGRRLEAGDIEFQGRLGRCVTIRGERVNLYELESVLMAHPALSDVAVTVWESAEGEPWLGAYIVADFVALPGVERLVDFAKTRLPRSALPDFFVGVGALPLAADGEVDYNALPPPDAAGIHVEVVWHEFCDPLQLRLKSIWEGLFGIQPIGIRENFFELGGHSLLAVRLMSEIRKQFGRELPLATLLGGATIEHLAEVLRDGHEPEPWSPLVQIQAGGDRLPLYCVHAMGGEVLNYLDLAHYLGPDQPVYGLQSRGFGEGKAGARRVEEMAAQYLEAMRKVQPQGPFCIAGFSFGGVIAVEMAQQLYAAGERQTWLGILDTTLMDNLPGKTPPAPQAAEAVAVDWAKLIMSFSRHDTPVTADDLRRLGSLEEQTAYAIEHGVLPYNLDLATAMRFVQAGYDNSEAKDLYVSSPYHGRIDLFRAKQGHVLTCPDPTLGWGRIARGGLHIHEVPGAHWNMLVRPHAQVIAGKIRAGLDGAQPPRPLRPQQRED